jgi:hypothetical protein
VHLTQVVTLEVAVQDILSRGQLGPKSASLAEIDALVRNDELDRRCLFDGGQSIRLQGQTIGPKVRTDQNELMHRWTLVEGAELRQPRWHNPTFGLDSEVTEDDIEALHGCRLSRLLSRASTTEHHDRKKRSDAHPPGTLLLQLHNQVVDVT